MPQSLKLMAVDDCLPVDAYLLSYNIYTYFVKTVTNNLSLILNDLSRYYCVNISFQQLEVASDKTPTGLQPGHTSKQLIKLTSRALPVAKQSSPHEVSSPSIACVCNQYL